MQLRHNTQAQQQRSAAKYRLTAVTATLAGRVLVLQVGARGGSDA